MKRIKRIAGVIAGIYIFAIIVRLLNYMYVADDQLGRAIWHNFYEDKGKIDNLYLGSSHVYCDIDPYQLDQLNGQYNFNLATSAQLMNGTYYLMREADRCNRLSHVYVELYYYYNIKDNFHEDRDLIEVDVAYNWSNTDYMQFSLNKLQYMAMMAEPEKYPDILWGFTRYRSHLGDWDWVKETMESKESEEYVNFQYYQDWGDGRGYDEYQQRGRLYSSRASADKARLLEQDRIISEDPMTETSEAYLRKVIAYCQEREIPITLFISPIYELQLISTENYDNYLEQVGKIAEEYDVDVYDFNLVREEYLSIQDTKYYRDFGHLNATGADLFTDFFHKVMSGDAAENRKYFYDSYEEKLAHAAPEVYGIYYRDEEEEEEEPLYYRNMFVGSNRDEGMEYKIVMIPEESKEQYMIQDFSENRVFKVAVNEHGTCMIIYRMKDAPDEVRTIEISY